MISDVWWRNDVSTPSLYNQQQQPHGGGIGFDGGVQKKLKDGGHPLHAPTPSYGKLCDWFIDALKHHENSHF